MKDANAFPPVSDAIYFKIDPIVESQIQIEEINMDTVCSKIHKINYFALRIKQSALKKY